MSPCPLAGLLARCAGSLAPTVIENRTVLGSSYISDMDTPLSRNMFRIAHMATPAPTGCSCCHAQRKSRGPEGHCDGNFLVLLLRNACFRLPHCRPAHSCRIFYDLHTVLYSTVQLALLYLSYGSGSHVHTRGVPPLSPPPPAASSPHPRSAYASPLSSPPAW